MKTAEEIIFYIESELAEAYELYDTVKGKDAHAALCHMIKIGVILELLDEIKSV